MTEEEWLKENEKSIDEWNDYVKRNGLPLKPILEEHDEDHECRSEKTGTCCGKCKVKNV